MAQGGDNEFGVGLHLVLPLGGLQFDYDDQPLAHAESPISLVLAALFGAQPAALQELLARRREKERRTERVYSYISAGDKRNLRELLSAGIDSADEDTLQLLLGRRDWRGELLACRKEEDVSQVTVEEALKKRIAPPLVFAAALGHLDVFQLLYLMMTAAAWNNDPRLTSSLEQQKSAALWWACRRSHMPTVSWLLSNCVPGVSTASACSVMGSSPLHAALHGMSSGGGNGGCVALTKLLIERGADINAGDSTHRGYTPLMIAVSRLCTDYERCADVDGAKTAESDGWYTTIWAELVQCLLSAGADVRSRTDSGLTVLHLAVRCGRPELVEELLKAGAEINGCDRWNETPVYCLVLHATAERGKMRKGDMQVLRCLVMHGCNVSICSTNDQCSAFHVMMHSGYWDAALLCLSECPGLDATAKGEEGDALHMLLDCVCGRYLTRESLPQICLQVFNILLEKGCSIIGSGASDTWHGWTPLQLASAGCQPVLVQRLLECGTATSATDISSRLRASPLHLACHHNKVATLCSLSQRLQDNLHASCIEQQYDSVLLHDRCLSTVKALIEGGADLSETTEDDLTPLHFAANSGSSELVDLLLSAGAPISKVSKSGETVLHSACTAQWCSDELVLRLVSAGVDVDCTTVGDELNCVQIAAILGRCSLLTILLQAGADPDLFCTFVPNGRQHRRSKIIVLPEQVVMFMQKPRLWTALHLAVILSRVDAVEALLLAGADPNLLAMCTKEDGISGAYTTLHLAMMRYDRPDSQRRVVELLCSDGAELEQLSSGGLRPLHFAYEEPQLSSRRVELLKILLENGANVNSLDKGKKGQSVLHRALLDHCIDVVSLLLKQYHADTNLRTRHGFTPLTLAISEARGELTGKDESPHYLECLVLLLEHGADVNCYTRGWSSPLHMASSACLVESVKLLLSAGANVDEHDCSSFTPLLAVLYDWPFNYSTFDRDRVSAVCAALIDGGSDVNQLITSPGEEAMTALHLACWYRLEAVVEKCIAANADLSIPCPFGLNPLHFALEQKGPITAPCKPSPAKEKSNAGRYFLNAHDVRRFILIMKMLCRAGVDCNFRDNKGQSMLHRCLQEEVYVVRELIEFGADVNMVANDGSSALFYAFSQDMASMNKSRLSLEDVQACNKMLSLAISEPEEMQRLRHGRCCLVSALLFAGAEPNVARRVDGKTPLHLAMQRGRPRCIAILLSNGADPNARDSCGETPLMGMMSNSHLKSPHDLEVLRALASYSPHADVNAVNASNGDSLLHHAVRMQSSNLISFLLHSAKAKADIANKKGRVPAHILFEDAEHRQGRREGDKGILRMLIGTSSCGLDVVDEDGNTPLMLLLTNTDFDPRDYRSFWKSLCTLESVNLVNRKGLTPLLLALSSKWVSEELVESLLDCGARIDLCTSAGNSPLHIACALRQVKLIKLLIRYGADCFSVNSHGATPFDACVLSHRQPVGSNGGDYPVGPGDTFFDMFGVTPDPNSPAERERRARHRLALNEVIDVMPAAMDALLADQSRLQMLLQSCVWMRQLDSIQALIDHGADLMMAPNGCVDCPLVLVAGCSCASDSDQLLRLLLDHPDCSTPDAVDALLLIAARRVQREIGNGTKFDAGKANFEDDSSLVSTLHSAVELHSMLGLPGPSPMLGISQVFGGRCEISTPDELQEALLDSTRLQLLCHTTLVSCRLLGQHSDLTFDLLRCLMAGCVSAGMADQFQGTFHILIRLMMEALIADASGNKLFPYSLSQRLGFALHTNVILGGELGSCAGSAGLTAEVRFPLAFEMMLGVKPRASLLHPPAPDIGEQQHINRGLLFDVAQQAVQLYCDLLKGGREWTPDLDSFLKWITQLIEHVADEVSVDEGKQVERTVLWLIQLVISVNNNTQPTQAVCALIRAATLVLHRVPTVSAPGCEGTQIGTLLHSACNLRPVGHLLVQLLLRAGLRPNVHLSESPCTPLHMYVRPNDSTQSFAASDAATLRQIADTLKLFIHCGAHTDVHWNGMTVTEIFLAHGWRDAQTQVSEDIQEVIELLNPPVRPLQCLAARAVKYYRHQLPVAEMLTPFLRQFVDLH